VADEQHERRKGPPVRTDIADLYVFRRDAQRSLESVEFLQMRRVGGAVDGTWHPVMGRIEAGETAPAAMLREAREEADLATPDLLGFWALGGVYPAYLPPRDPLLSGQLADECVLLAPRLAAEVSSGWEPKLNHEHDAYRWIARDDVDRSFLWPTQRAAIRELLEMLEPGSIAEPQLRLAIPNPGNDPNR